MTEHMTEHPYQKRVESNNPFPHIAYPETWQRPQVKQYQGDINPQYNPDPSQLDFSEDIYANRPVHPAQGNRGGDTGGKPWNNHYPHRNGNLFDYDRITPSNYAKDLEDGVMDNPNLLMKMRDLKINQPALHQFVSEINSCLAQDNSPFRLDLQYQQTHPGSPNQRIKVLLQAPGQRPRVLGEL